MSKGGILPPFPVSQQKCEKVEEKGRGVWLEFQRMCVIIIQIILELNTIETSTPM